MKIHKKKWPKGLHFALLFVLSSIILGCPQPSDPKAGDDSAGQTSELRTFKPEIKIDEKLEATHAQDIVGLRFIVQSPEGPVLAETDSITLKLRLRSEAHWNLSQVEIAPTLKMLVCGHGDDSPMTVTSRPAIFDSDSTEAVIPIKLVTNSPLCEESFVIMDGGLIVVIEESLPDTHGSVSFEDVLAWYRGESSTINPVE